jgi:hypothetical protein
MTARNFNPVMATAGKVTIVEVEEIVEAGALDANSDPHARHLCRPDHPQHDQRKADREADHSKPRETV